MSQEQRAVLDCIRAGHNVVVDACAGSGKSTTILSIAKELTGKKILQFTYNSMLRHEVKEKVRELELKNIQVHTYHSFAVKYYSAAAHTDTGIRQVVRAKTPPKQALPEVDIVVLDESQDMTMLYYQLILRMFQDMFCSSTPTTASVQLLILGDYRQGLYEFKGADIRFLTKADQFWSLLPWLQSPVFRRCTLKMSYRVTNQMARFVNRDMLGEERLLACRDGPPVTYIRRPRFQIEQIVVYQIRRLLQEGESPSDIFVLGGSVKGTNSNIRHMENTLTEHDIPCHVPMMETAIVDERVIDGKVVFSTFHTVKGRQRKYVFVVGFDQGYFYNARSLPKDVCPNTLYVGCTRATHGLYLLENDSSRPLEFLKHSQHEMKQSDYIDFKGMPQTIFYDREPVQDPSIVLIPTYHVTPTDIIKFVPEAILEEISPLLDTMFVQEVDPSTADEIPFPKVVYTSRGLYEDVSDLNGIAIPALYYDQMIKSTTATTETSSSTTTTTTTITNQSRRGEDMLRSMIQGHVQEMRENSHGYLKRAVQGLPERCETVSDYLYLANVATAVQEKLYSKLKQIGQDEYTWLQDSVVQQCQTRLDANLGHEFGQEGTPPPEIEKLLIHHSQEVEHAAIDAALYPYFSYEMRFRFSARADLVTTTTLWELKCTSKISQDHLMQVVIYAWLWQVLHPSCPRVVRILNIQTGECLRLDATLDNLTYIVSALLRGKYQTEEPISDDEFIRQCRDHIASTTNAPIAASTIAPSFS